MNIANLPAGRYVVAVSGGIDSMVLLDILANMPDLELIVAHFDHGMRSDSARDAAFVAERADHLGLQFISARAELGAAASEEKARDARYEFLRRVSKRYSAPIITAHHQDDVLETIIINLLRGTGWRGLCSLRDTESMRRPLLSDDKVSIRAYAAAHQLAWREDSTNANLKYLRNRVRSQLLPKLTVAQRQEFLALAARQTEIRQEVEEKTTQFDCIKAGQGSIILPRTWLICLPAQVQAEVLRYTCQQLTAKSLERRMLARARWFIATARPHKTLQMQKNTELQVQKATVVVRARSI